MMSSTYDTDVRRVLEEGGDGWGAVLGSARIWGICLVLRRLHGEKNGDLLHGQSAESFVP